MLALVAALARGWAAAGAASATACGGLRSRLRAVCGMGSRLRAAWCGTVGRRSLQVWHGCGGVVREYVELWGAVFKLWGAVFKLWGAVFKGAAAALVSPTVRWSGGLGWEVAVEGWGRRWGRCARLLWCLPVCSGRGPGWLELRAAPAAAEPEVEGEEQE